MSERPVPERIVLALAGNRIAMAHRLRDERLVTAQPNPSGIADYVPIVREKGDGADA